jgi:hypothetical protein
VFGFVPPTFCLPQDLRLLERAMAEAGSRGKWIVKPPNAARGIGIRVVDAWEDIPKSKPTLVQQCGLACIVLVFWLGSPSRAQVPRQAVPCQRVQVYGRMRVWASRKTTKPPTNPMPPLPLIS